MKEVNLPGVSGRLIFCVAIVCMLMLFSSASGGNLDSSNAPSGGSGMPTLQGIYNQLDTGTTAGNSTSFQEPAAGPTAGTGKNLSEIQGKLPVLDNTNGLTPAEAPDGKSFWGLSSGAWGLQTGSNVNMVDTSSGDATAADIQCGKKAWVDGIEVTGTMSCSRIDLEKSTYGMDADEPPGPGIFAGEPVMWTYMVTNTGSQNISDIVVVDDKRAIVACPKTFLAPGESMTCTAQGTAEVGQYMNIGIAAGKSPSGIAVFDMDRSHYEGAP